MTSPSPAVPSLEELIERNRHYASQAHTPRPTLLQMLKNDPKLNGPHILIVACLDSRCNPYEVLGIKPYEGIVIRNIGGRFITNASDIAALDTLFRIHQIILLQHDNCGASHITTPQVLDAVRAKRPEFEAAGGRTSAELAARLPAKQDNYESLKEDLKTAKQCGFLREDLIDNMVGLWLDVNSGLVTRIYPDPESSP